MSFHIRKALLFIPFFFLAVPALQSQAKDASFFKQPKAALDFLRPSNVLSRDIVNKAKPGVLLCIVRTKGEKENIGRIMIDTVDETGAVYCEYSIYGVKAHEYTHFEWLDAGYYELLGFFYTHGQRVSQMGHQTFFAMRAAGSPRNAPCASVDYKNGSLKFGYEYFKGDSFFCDGENPKKESPIYYHTYRRLICYDIEETGATDSGNIFQFSQFAGGVNEEPSGCVGGVTFFPKCHNCSDGGCSALTCTWFTTWDECPSGSYECGLEICVSGFCNDRRWCRQNR